jgi:hypothetical protein
MILQQTPQSVLRKLYSIHINKWRHMKLKMFLPKCAERVYLLTSHTAYQQFNCNRMSVCAPVSVTTLKEWFYFYESRNVCQVITEILTLRKFLPWSKHVISIGNTVAFHVIRSYPIRISTWAAEFCQILPTNYRTVPLNRKKTILSDTLDATLTSTSSTNILMTECCNQQRLVVF